jgi:ActR/RegA family two-component response regulator
MSRKIKLLFVDDEERFLTTLSARLGLRDFDVTCATSGETALALAEKERFDIALVDLKMPGLSGDQLLAALKERHPEIEVVILTGYGTIQSAESCTKLGSYRYLQKPCETDELLRVLKDAYWQRIQRKLKLDEDKMAELLESFAKSSPLAILRELKALVERKEE